jgi:putative DNA primase/helicase
MDRALTHARNGRAVFPLKPGGKVPMPGSRGFKDATRSQARIESWWTKIPKANIGLATGEPSGLLVLDFDDPAALPRLEVEIGDLPVTRRVNTPSGGFHLYFKLPEGVTVRCRTGLRPGLDIRADGGYVVAPGSRNGTAGWTWEDATTPIAKAPKRLLSLLMEKPARAPRSAVANDDVSRHARLVRQTWRDRASELSQSEVLSRALESTEGRALVAEGREAEIERMVEGAFAKAPDAFHLTDLGNAQRFVAEHGQAVRYSYTSKSWLVWTGCYWRRDATAEVQRLAKGTVVGLYAEAAIASNEDARKRLVAHAAKSERAERIAAMLRMAESEPEVATTDDAFDQGIWLLNVANGTLDLRTGELRPHDPANLITHLLDVPYDAEARCPRWNRFLRQVLAGDKALEGFIRRFAGYVLTGSTREQVLALLYGRGKNGKSVFLETLRALLGPLSRTARFDSFLVKRHDGIPTDIARLRGARLVTAAEAQEGCRLDEALIKQLTGGDTITARFLYGHEFEYRATFKLLLVANHRPVIRGTDLAIWRRVKLVPFTVTISEDDRDPDLADKLRAELPGILAWAVRGCLEWQRDGLGEPSAVREATASYRSEMDVLGAFLAERCEESPDAIVSAKRLYYAYAIWSEACRERPVSKRAFGLALEERGFQSTRVWVPADGATVRAWQGIALHAAVRRDQRPGNTSATRPTVATAATASTSGNSFEPRSLKEFPETTTVATVATGKKRRR